MPIRKVTFTFNDGTLSRPFATINSDELDIDLRDGFYVVSCAGVVIASARAELVKSYETDLVAP